MTTMKQGVLRVALGVACLGGIAAAQPITPSAKGGNNKGNAACAAFCNTQFGIGTLAADNCIRLAARGKGVCYQCGPAATGTTLTACSGTCVDLQTDAGHCGACTTACSSGQTCTSGACTGGTVGECGRFDGTNSGTWQTMPSPFLLYGGFTDYTPSGQTGLYYYDGNYNTWSAYDVTTGTWTLKATPPMTSDQFSGTAWVGDTIYAISKSSVYAYGIASNAWTTLFTSVIPTEMSMATSDGAGHVYAVAADDTIVRYDIAGNTVSYPAAIPGPPYEPRIGFDACSGKLFVGPSYFGGALWSIDPANSYAVTMVASQPEGYLNDIFCSDRSGHIYAGGSTDIPTSFWKYDIATDTWSRMPDLPDYKGNAGSCTVADDGYLYVYNGEFGPLWRIKLN